MSDAHHLVTRLAAGRAEEWDLRGELPREVIRELGAKGLLCAQVPQDLGGLGLSSLANGELTAHTGTLCSSLRSVMTSQGIAAWTLSRFGSREQRADFLPRLTSGESAGVAFSEPEAGSDLSAMRTEITRDGDSVVVHGAKVWVTGAHYAQWLVVFGRVGRKAGDEPGAGDGRTGGDKQGAVDGRGVGSGQGGAIVVVPTDAPGVRIDRVPDPLGCRAAGHAHVTLDRVRLPARHLLGGAGMPLSMLVASALTYGRISVAWGCVGILRSCLSEAVRHAGRRRTFGAPLGEHQLVRRHLAELHAAERTSTYACREASRHWDENAAEQMHSAVLAKHVSATAAARGASAAAQVLASAGARDGHVVARAYRDTKLMEIIEGSNEISQLMLADQALAVWA
ncbi:acyl-CoA dehydrogenase family protein [Streptomyces sp. P1-3]|uniref:acyl-CoA dehydrogenase family protein n=1 Tax=Streptomyces sp. P1-3 TaxID=3421658 RepID=UPI003D35E546